MADSFGVKMGIEGEKEFKDALKDINQSFKILGSEMNLVTSQFDKQDKSIQAMTARNAVLNKEIDTQKTKITTLDQALRNASTSFGENDRRTQAWQVQLNNAKAALNGMEKELEQNNKALDEVSQGFNEAEQEANEFSDEIDKVAKKTRESSGHFEKLGGALKGVAVAIGAALVGAGVAAVKISDDYITALNGVQAATGTTTEDMGQFQESMQNIYRGNYGESFDDIGKALTVVAQTSKDVSPAELEKLTTNALILRDTFEYDISDTMRAVNMLTKQFGITGDEAFDLIAQGTQKGLNKNGDFLDSLNEYSSHYSQLGLDAEDMFNSLANGTEAGTFSVDKLGDAMKEFGIRVKDESKGTTEAFQTLGLDAANISSAFAEGGDKGQEAFTKVIDKLKAMDDPLAQNQVGVALFGSMWEDLGKEGVFALSNLNGEIDASVGALSKINEVKYNSISEAVSGLGRMFTADFVLPISNGVLPILSELGTALSQAGGDWSQISVAIGEALSSLITMIMNSLPQILTLGTEIIMSLLSGLIETLPQITEGALQLVLTLLNGIIANLPALVEGAILMIITLATGIGDALPELIPAIVEAILLIVTTLLNNMDKILDAAFKIIEGLAKGLINSLPKLIEALPKIISTIITFMLTILPKIYEMGLRIVAQLAIGLVKAIPQLIASLPRIVGAVLSGIGNAVVGIAEIGRNIVRGLWNGIASMVTWIRSKISDFVGGIVSGVKGVLGIKSPSTVFAGIGDNMAVGLGQGFDRAMTQVSKDIQGAVPTDFVIGTTLNVDGKLNNQSGGGDYSRVEHSGTIEVRGINNQNDLIGVVDIIMDQFRREARA